MMEGLDDAEEEQYFEDNPKIIPLFEVDIMQTLTPYFSEDAKEQEILVDDKTMNDPNMKLRKGRCKYPREFRHWH